MDERQAAATLMTLINGYQVSQAIHVAASLGVADLLKDGARPSHEVASAAGAQPAAMCRLLHALASVGVVEKHEDARFSLTELGQCLRSDSPHSRAAWARYVGRPYIWCSWGEMRHSVTTGEPAFEHLYGTGIWDWRAQHPEETQVFDAAMTELAGGVSDVIAEAFDFSRFGRLVEVGGGHGALMSAILARNPGITGILFDLPHVVAGSAQTLRGSHVLGRCEVVGGDMHAGLPPDGDAYLFKSVLMDEDDETVGAILQSCRSVIRPGGRLIIVERLMEEPAQGNPNLTDLTMLVITGGRERSSAEFSDLLDRAGFRLDQRVATRSPFTLLIGLPA